MTFSFNTPLSGLNSASNAINVVGNNIANANTIGFRSGSITFLDVFSNIGGVRLNGGGNTRQIGSGVQTGAIYTNFSQGNLNESFSPLHAAVQGDGFFSVKETDGTAGFTRAGDFTVNREGFLVTPNGAQVQGYQAENGAIPQDAVLTAVRIPIGQTTQPQVTTNATQRMNLDSDAATGAVFHSTVQVFDTKGSARTLDMTFTRQTNGDYNMTATVDGNPATLSENGNPTSATPVAFSFDATGGLTNPTSLSIEPDQAQLNGATLATIDVNLRVANPDGSPGDFNITGFSRPSAIASTDQDGFPAGELRSAALDPSGLVFGVFSNGQSRVVGQYAIAKFNSNEGLQ